MNIVIKDINPHNAVSIPGTAQVGFLAEFETPIVAGQATVVPRGGNADHLTPGKSIRVEPKQEYVYRYSVLKGPSTAEMKSLSDPCDYSVIGPVIYSYDTGDFGVQVGEFIFTLSADDALGVRPDAGQWVSFNVRGLSFMDRSV